MLNLFISITIAVLGLYSINSLQPEMNFVSKEGFEMNADSVVLPIRRAGNLLLVEAEVDGLVGNFIIDFGAQKLVLNATYFRDGRNVRRQASGLNSSVMVMQKRVEKLGLRELQFSSLTADVIELGHIENRRSVRIFGLLGVSLFSDLGVKFDIQRGSFTVYKKVPTKINSDLKFDFQYRNSVILLKGEINKKPLLFSFDTGAESNALDKLCPKRVMESLNLNRRFLLRGSAGGAVEVLAGTMGSVEIGGHSFRGMRTIVTDLSEIGEVYGSSIDGMLGYDFLNQGSLVIDFETKTMMMDLYNKDR